MPATADAPDPNALLSPHGRMSRLQYIAWSGGLSLLITLATMVLSMFVGMLVPALGMLTTAFGYLLVFALLLIFTIRRCHDFDATGWLALLVVAPLAALVFWIIPGSGGDNRFGPPPRPNSATVQAVAWIVVALTALGLLAAAVAPGVMVATMQPPA